MTVKEWLEQHYANPGQLTGAERAEAVNKCVNALNKSPSCVRKILRRLAGKETAPTRNVPATKDVDGGIDLDAATVYEQKPADQVKSLLYSLPKDRAFPVSVLAEEWGRSPKTIEDHAKRHGCFRYVEPKNDPGNYIRCIVHPDSARKMRGEK